MTRSPFTVTQRSDRALADILLARQDQTHRVGLLIAHHGQIGRSVGGETRHDQAVFVARVAKADLVAVRALEISLGGGDVGQGAGDEQAEFTLTGVQLAGNKERRHAGERNDSKRGGKPRETAGIFSIRLHGSSPFAPGAVAPLPNLYGSFTLLDVPAQ